MGDGRWKMGDGRWEMGDGSFQSQFSVAVYKTDNRQQTTDNSQHLFIRPSWAASEMHNTTEDKACFFKDVHHGKIVVVGVCF